jgi:trigger factor
MASATPVTTTVTELPESRVRVEAEVPAAEVERRLAQAARQLARNLRVPGFRAGKAPPPVVIRRVGRAAVLDEAVRESLSAWYTAAVDAARIVPVGEPDLDIGDLPAEGEPLRFSIEIGVRPKATLGDYKGVEVGKREVEISDEEVGAELDRLRERSAKLDTVERPAAKGDFVVMDFAGTLDGSTASRSAAARAATRWSSSAPAGSCPASRTSSRARAPARSARSRSPSRTTTWPRSSRASRPSSPSR